MRVKIHVTQRHINEGQLGKSKGFRSRTCPIALAVLAVVRKEYEVGVGCYGFDLWQIGDLRRDCLDVNLPKRARTFVWEADETTGKNNHTGNQYVPGNLKPFTFIANIPVGFLRPAIVKAAQ